jgi:hypothetical protein
MKKALVVVIAVMLYALPAFSQKGSTIWGDIFTGNVIATDEAKREITLQYIGKEGTETFVGALTEGYQVKMKDGSARDLKVSELPPGIRIRAYYKKISKEVRGQTVKGHLITRIEFLGRDEFAAMRRYLKVEPSTTATLIESKTLPDADPLRLKIVGDNAVSKDEVIKWADNWNKREAKKYGQVTVVSDVDQADVSLVIHKGSESLAATVVPVISAFLVLEKPTGLEVIWKNLSTIHPTGLITPALSHENQVAAIGTRITAEIEKRLKFRHKGKQK